MTADVITLPNSLDALAQSIRGAYERTEHGRREWIEGTLELAASLAEARKRFPSNSSFGAWLGENELDVITHQDRAALIRMADDFVTARRVLEETMSFSWRLIVRDEFEPRLTSAGKTDMQTPIPAKAPSTPETEAKALPEKVSSEKQTKPVSKRSPFFGLPRADEVEAAYLDLNARTVIGKAVRDKGGKAIWSLILDAIDAGFLTQTKSAFSKVSLRVLFPSADLAYCMRFMLTDANDRKQVKERIMPAALANSKMVKSMPVDLERFVSAHWQREQEISREAAAKQKVVDALRAMPTDQREIVMFGERLWPRIKHEYGTYDYDQLCAAIWYFRDLDGWLQGSMSGKTPGSRAIITRLSTRWPQEYVDRAYPPDPPELRGKIKKVYQLVALLARLLEAKPDGECVVPPSPKSEGQW